MFDTAITWIQKSFNHVHISRFNWYRLKKKTGKKSWFSIPRKACFNSFFIWIEKDYTIQDSIWVWTALWRACYTSDILIYVFHIRPTSKSICEAKSSAMWEINPNHATTILPPPSTHLECAPGPNKLLFLLLHHLYGDLTNSPTLTQSRTTMGLAAIVMPVEPIFQLFRFRSSLL